jgi:hypothetical protein
VEATFKNEFMGMTSKPIKWKLQNLSHLKSTNPTKFRLQHEELAQRFQEKQL